MASKKKTHLDPNQIIESSPHFLQYMIQLVEHMLQDSEILKRTDCKNIRSYRHLKSSLQRLLNLLYKAESVSLITCSDTERYLAQLKSLQAEFFAIGGDTSGVCAEAISILDVLKAYVVSKKDGTKPGTAQRKLIETSADEKYKQFHDFSHAQFPQSELLAYPLGGGHSKIPNDDQNNDASINPTGNEPLAENLAKSDQPPDDGDVPPSGEAAIQESNNSPVNPPHYQGVLDGFASGGNTRFTSLQLSPYLYGEGTKEQLLPVKQQCNFEETVADPVVDPVEAIDHPTAQNSAQLCSQTNSNGGLATCEIVSPTTTTYTTTITVHAKDSIKDVKKETELDSFTSECGGLAEARRKSPVPIGPLHSPVGTITVCPIPVSGGPQNVVTASTQQAATVWNYEELSLDPRNTRL